VPMVEQGKERIASAWRGFAKALARHGAKVGA
jgi:hypothetical protein